MYGITRGNISHKITGRIASMPFYTFLKNLDDIPDKYTKSIKTIIPNPKWPHIQTTIFEKSIEKLTSMIIKFVPHHMTVYIVRTKYYLNIKMWTNIGNQKMIIKIHTLNLIF